MRIYSMTATFGKLEQQTLILKPGLNVVHAPNEWGKSTWCAFLAAMLYGMETRAKTTKTALAEKERFAPWSGSPMEGRIDINWQGKDITIERKTSRRIPLGEFRAYETATGLAVKELSGANCGTVLLGVERSVFLRAGFIRFVDLPVSEDEALRRRLNALVTTGDESATGDRLGVALRDLKNRCRYHKTGLLPQAEARRAELEDKLHQLENCEAQMERTEKTLTQLRNMRRGLENHRVNLQYQAALENSEQLGQAESSVLEARHRQARAEERCRQLPDPEQLMQKKKHLSALEQTWLDLQMEQYLKPRQPEAVPAVPPFRGMESEEALLRVQDDGARYERLKKKQPLLFLVGLCLLIAGGVTAVWYLLPGLLCAGLGGALLAAGLVTSLNRQRKARAIAEVYGGGQPVDWQEAAEQYARNCRDYAQKHRELAQWEARREQQFADLRQRIAEETGGLGLEAYRRELEAMERAWEEFTGSSRELRRWEQHLQSLRAVVKMPEKPAFPDELAYSAEKTEDMLSGVRSEQNRLQNLLGQYQGRMEAMGRREDLQSELQQVKARIAQLEQTCAALTLAQETLTQAAQELQRRFAPRITQRAQKLMAAFTAGRYDRVLLREDLTVRAAASQETTLRDALWRSDGTTDQLYLALRLAVAEELTPEVPLILDDALVRFDDERLHAAMEVLKAVAKQKQVILFTCQSREEKLM